MNSLQQKVVLITGGARGLGEAISRNLAEAGATVVIADFRGDQAAKVAQSIQAKDGRAHALSLDITQEKDIDRAVDTVISRHGKLDVLINNAGVDVTLPIDEIGVSDWNRILATNLTAPFLLSRKVLPHMREHKGGQILNVVSTAAKRAWANASAYHASKWGLLGYSHALHVEARPHNIKVTALICGGMRTPFLLERFPDIDVGTLQDPMDVARTVQFVLTVPEGTVIPEVMALPMRETSWP